MRTGIIGGTFDPIHNAHLMLAEEAYKKFNLDRVLFMIAPNPPHKNDAEILDIQKRIDMVKLAIKDKPYFEFSDFELEVSNSPYLANTLTKYKELYPQEDVFFVIGSDSLFSITSWYRPDIIFDKCTILAAKRDDNTKDSLDDTIKNLRSSYNANIYELEVLCSNISSTKIRQSTDRNELGKYVPQAVAEYIIDNRIYSEYKGSKRWTNAELAYELKNTLNSERYIHTINVAKVAKEMAEALGENPNKAYLAGLLHDCAKNVPDNELLDICLRNHIEISDAEKENPYLLHAKVGALYAQDKYNITDNDIINAIRYHTTGTKDMTLLEKILFIADYIEPGRYKQKNLELLRELAYTDIDKAVYYILRDTIDYLKSRELNCIDENTFIAYEYYREIIEK